MRTVPAGPKIAYVLKRFPRLSETFILHEILELERRGFEVEVFSLMHPIAQEPLHDVLATMKASVTYLPQSDALKTWKVGIRQANGDSAVSRVTHLFTAESAPFADLLPSDRPKDVSLFSLQATTLAILAAVRGVTHMHAHFASAASSVALLASRFGGIPFSFTAHARDIYSTYVNPQADDDRRRKLMAEASFVVTVSEYNLRHLTGLAGKGAARKVHRLYNGIDLERFKPNTASRAPDSLLAVGRLVEKKGFRDLVEACRLLRLDGYDFRCQIVGDGPEHGALTQQIHEAGLNGHVQLMGAMNQEQLIGLMQAAAAMVLPCVVSSNGDRDGLPTVLLEALAMGLPALSTTVAGIVEIIDHDHTGLLSAPNDPASLAAQMARLLTQPDLRQRLARDGRLKAERQFDLHKNVGVLADMISDSISGTRISARAAQ